MRVGDRVVTTTQLTTVDRPGPPKPTSTFPLNCVAANTDSELLTAQKSDLIIIDTLPKELFEKRRLPGAQNACVFQVGFLSEVEAIAPDRDREVVLYGSSSVSHDSVTAAEKLVRVGYSKVFVLSGGLAAWREAGYPLAGNDPDSAGGDDQFRLDDRTYAVDIEQSIIEWTGRNPNRTHYGTLRLLRGDVRIQQGKLNGNFEIDMHSLKNLNLEGDEWQPVLIAHLKSDDFFFTESFRQPGSRSFGPQNW